MSRYIEADKVLKELHLNHKDVIYIDKNDTAKRIEKIPSIDICFCRGCKYYKDEWCYWRDVEIRADDFCSYGQKGDENVETD